MRPTFSVLVGRMYVTTNWLFYEHHQAGILEAQTYLQHIELRYSEEYII